MISLVRNLLVQNVLKKELRGDLLVQLRCIPKSYHVNKSDYLMTTTRTMSTIVYSKPKSIAATEDKSREFMSYFPDFVRDLRERAEKYDSLGTGKHLERVLQYNVLGGKNYRGVIAVQAYELMAPKSSLTEENVKLSMYLGWCVELFQACTLMLDDIMDESLTRRGKTCWYKVDDIGMSCINDAVMVEAGIFQILDQFSHLDCYVKLLELFHEVSFATSLGQYMDTKTRYEDVLSFTMEKYISLVTNKSFYYTFYFPIAAATYLAGKTDQEGLQKTKSLLVKMNNLFQPQNDVLDCYRNSALPNMIGSDIQNNSCTWLAVKCLERANEAQKAIIKENYGKNDIESIRRVKQLYEELSLPEVYDNYEKEMHNMLWAEIQEATHGIPVELCMQMIEKLQKRVL